MKYQSLSWFEFIKYDNYVFDMDGTLYLGGITLKNAEKVFNNLVALGKNVTVMTNNSAKTTLEYAKKLQALGFDCKDEMVINSTTATIAFLHQQYPKKKVFPVGTKSMREQLLKGKINIVENNPDIVLVGNDQELTSAKLEKACHFLQDGAIFIGTNPDYALPLKDGYYNCDCGSICKMIELTVNRKPIFIGKPNKEMLSFIKTGKTILVGDRLYTDIQLGINNNFDTLLVLSGEAKESDIEKTKVYPTFVAKSLGDLLNQ